jgi:hypothetical protein
VKAATIVINQIEPTISFMFRDETILGRLCAPVIPVDLN